MLHISNSHAPGTLPSQEGLIFYVQPNPNKTKTLDLSLITNFYAERNPSRTSPSQRSRGERRKKKAKTRYASSMVSIVKTGQIPYLRNPSAVVFAVKSI